MANTSGVAAWGDRSVPRWGNLPLPEPHLAALALGVLLERRRPWPVLPRTRHRAGMGAAVGAALTAVGVGLIVASWRAAGRTDLEQPDQLVAHGPYAHSRNPMYVGWASVHLGTSLVAGSGWMFAGIPVALALVHRQVLREERALGTAFGTAFERYRRSVPRYVPHLDRWANPSRNRELRPRPGPLLSRHRRPWLDPDLAL